MATVYLALGSNVGDSRVHIEQAIQQLDGILDGLQAAPLYLSKAMGYSDQADFINTAVSGGTGLEPINLLHAVKAIEQQVGRTPTFQSGPREIDIDIIFYDDLQLKTDILTIPHRDFAQRDFVLRPLSDLNPNLLDPVSGHPLSQLLKELDPAALSIIKQFQS